MWVEMFLNKVTEEHHLANNTDNKIIKSNI